ncbi:hypothetical protein [Shewanella marina]|uniref:hypothetical protein n=1 Tax=Shewanella marina TaxID=487319 RepID=UPI00046F00AD|nr:hypothetical protein [Shewanella marina]
MRLIIRLLISIALISLFSCRVSTAAESELIIDYNEKYLSLDLKWVCTKQGQVKFTLTNVSGETLTISNNYLNDDGFDTTDTSIKLYDLKTGKRPSFIKMHGNSHYNRDGHFTVMPDEVIEYLPIDFRKITRNLDVKRKYRMGVSFLIPVITSSGVEMLVNIDSIIMDRKGRYIKFGPKCFK